MHCWRICGSRWCWRSRCARALACQTLSIGRAYFPFKDLLRQFPHPLRLSPSSIPPPPPPLHTFCTVTMHMPHTQVKHAEMKLSEARSQAAERARCVTELQRLQLLRAAQTSGEPFMV